MKVPFSFLTEQFENSEPIFKRLREFLRRCDFTLGEDVFEFEKKYAQYCGVKHAIGVGSGTDALALSLKVSGIESGDEILTPPNSFVATTGAIVQVGAKPVYVDVLEDYTINPELLERHLTPKTKAIVPVHWAGNSANITAITKFAEAKGLIVVEDACQALGARFEGKSVGSFGLFGAFSVHPIKPLHVWGDGGVIVTNSDELADVLRKYRNHGLSGRDTVDFWGVNSRLDNVHAIVGNYIFETLDDTIEKRRQIAAAYDSFFKTKLAGKIKVPYRDPKKFSVYHLYQVEAENRDELCAYTREAGIETKIHYPVPLHLQPAAKAWNYRAGMFPVTERQSTNSITLPCHQFISQNQIEYTLETIQKFYA